MTGDDRLHDLIQADLDGVLSAAERAELARLLLQDPEARRLHGQMQRTDRLLHDIPAAEPPQSLRAAVLAASAQAGTVTNRWRRFSAYRIAAAFVGGILVVGVAYLLSDGRAPNGELQGSVVADTDRASAVAAQPPISVQGDGIKVEASLRRERGKLRLKLVSSAVRPGELAVLIDPAATTFAGDRRDATVAVTGGEVSVPLPAGVHVTQLDFSGAAPLRLELRTEGRVVGEAPLSLSEP